MTTIAVVRKNGYAAIAADTLTKWGTGKESAAYVANNTKIVRVGESYIAGSGTSTFKLILRDYFARRDVLARFDSTIHIFKTWQAFHAVLKEQYYLVTVGEKDDTIESSKFDVLIANPHGIFGVGAHRTVQEYRKFYAIGSGTDLALGAMFAAYDRPRLSAEQVARRAIKAAAEFDDATGLPVVSHSIRLKAGKEALRPAPVSQSGNRRKSSFIRRLTGIRGISVAAWRQISSGIDRRVAAIPP